MAGSCFPLIIGHNRPLSKCQKENQRQWLLKNCFFLLLAVRIETWTVLHEGRRLGSLEELCSRRLRIALWAKAVCLHLGWALNHTFLAIPLKIVLCVDMVGGLWFKRSTYPCTWESKQGSAGRKRSILFSCHKLRSILSSTLWTEGK